VSTGSRASRFPLSLQIVVAMVAGVALGPLLGPSAAPLGEIGKLVIQLIKAVAAPLVFFAIVHAILTTEIPGRAGLRMLAFAMINGSVALAIGLLLSNLIKPGRLLAHLPKVDPGAAAAYADKKIDILKTFAGFFPSSVVQPFVDNFILSVVMLALLLGFALRTLKGRRAEEADEVRAGITAIEHAVAALRRVMELVLGWIIATLPFAVFGVVTRTVAEHGLSPLHGLIAYLGVGLLGMGLHVALWYNLLLVVLATLTLRRFWAEAREPVVYALGANSSLATLPMTLRALDRLGVSRSASALGACVGTNFNNDGIILYEGMAVLFVAQAHGIDLSLTQQLLAAGACLVAAMGVAGVPEAGLISLALVLGTVGLPVELLPLLLTVDWILGRARSATNVLSDMVLSIMTDRGMRRAPRDAA
jgi:DAACS family dicarboxylate/amino acid:cation (Na+ or H+) symporter